MKKKKIDNWELEPNEVWVITEKAIEPTVYFLKWWQDLSTQKYGDDSHWLDIAFEFGYVSKKTNPRSGVTIYEPIGFDYDPQQVHKTLGISPDMPIIRYKETGQAQYQRMLDKLFNNDGGKNDY